MYASWVCPPRERRPFSSLNFRSGAANDSPKKKSAPEHHHFTFFAVPETIIFNISLISTRSSPPTAGLPSTSSNAKRSGSAPGLAAGQSASQTHPPVSSGDPHFHARARSEAPHFHARGRSRPPPPHVSLCRGIYLYQTLGGGGG